MRAQQALRESEERYRELFENAKEAIYVHDLAGTYTSINRAAELLIGYRREEILGKHFSAFLAPEYTRFVIDNFHKKLSPEDHTDYEVEVINKRGMRVPVEVSSRMIQRNGELVGVQGSVRDISDRKRAYAATTQLAAIVHSSYDAIIGMDLDGIITNWNQGAEKIYFYSAGEAIGRSITMLAPVDKVEEVHAILAKVRRGVQVTNYETVRKRKDGLIIDVALTVSPVTDSAGNVVGASTIARDITERKRAQAELQDYSRRLIVAQESERHRIAQELHDQIGQALTAVRMNLQAVRSISNGSELTDHINETMTMVDETLDQVRALSLDLRPPYLDDFGLHIALRHFVDAFCTRAKLKADVEFDLSEIDERLPGDLETACFRITQEALTNIARHAGASTVFIKLTAIEDQVQLFIGDDGVGFDLHNRGKSVPPLQSLGLRGMRERAEALGGQFTIESAPSKGTRIRVSFPLN